MASFSLTEKLAVTGAFLAVVALIVGTENDPGLVVTGQETVKELRPAVPSSAPLAQAAPQNEAEAPRPSPANIAPPDAVTTARQSTTDAGDDKQFSPELGRVPLDFSNGPPAT